MANMTLQERLAKLQSDRQKLAQNIDQAVARLHFMDGQIELLTELITAETPEA
jgi:hypothetical protein